MLVACVISYICYQTHNIRGRSWVRTPVGSSQRL